MPRGLQELTFLGLMVSSRRPPRSGKTAVVSSFPEATEKKAVRRFLGLYAYYRPFVEGFSGIAEPVTCLTREDIPFFWTEEQKVGFAEMCSSLQTAPILAHFDDNSYKEIRIDSSNVGIGAILVQWQQGARKL